jgi:hypothetical protein
VSEDFYSKLPPDYKKVEGCNRILPTPTWTVPYKHRASGDYRTHHILCLDVDARQGNHGKPPLLDNNYICINTQCPKHELNGKKYTPPTGLVLVGS